MKEEETEYKKAKVKRKGDKLESRFRKLLETKNEATCINKSWENIMNSVKKAAKETLRIKINKIIRKKWVTQGMPDKMDERSQWIQRKEGENTKY